MKWMFYRSADGDHPDVDPDVELTQLY